MRIFPVDMRLLLTWKEDFDIIPAWLTLACLAESTGDVGRRFRLVLIVKNVDREGENSQCVRAPIVVLARRDAVVAI